MGREDGRWAPVWDWADGQARLGDGYVNDVPLKTQGGAQQVIIIAEAAATYLLSRRNTEQGRRLNRFIHVEVLPTIRKTGAGADGG